MFSWRLSTFKTVKIEEESFLSRCSRDNRTSNGPYGHKERNLHIWRNSCDSCRTAMAKIPNGLKTIRNVRRADTSRTLTAPAVDLTVQATQRACKKRGSTNGRRGIFFSTNGRSRNGFYKTRHLRFELISAAKSSRYRPEIGLGKRTHTHTTYIHRERLVLLVFSVNLILPLQESGFDIVVC